MRVVHISDQTSDQSFFVNTVLLRRSCEDAYTEEETEGGMRSTGDGWIDWVSLGNPPVLVGSDALPLPLINEAQVPSRR